ncbi:hypothetical protein CYMTET_6100 [Cymbomonas tetramitiformis]|uniref:Guanylate-binding protein/Atlastin C-terminal domain-containing protein n=1 Tax=Cymbomonas tetramitiformis TaxID=36881 RepID=A0AAE0GZR4_9CHLO|nr:hypothetical protein CYMTET_6100 [Cymbomonas tetramitiformis]
MTDEKKLQKLGSVDPSELRPEFREGLSHLLSQIFSKAQPKQIGGAILSGSLLAGLAGMYTSAINEGAVPTIATAWQSVCEAECRRALEMGEAAYSRTFKACKVEDESSLEAAHQRALAAATKAFEECAVGDKEVHRAYEERLQQTVTRHLERSRERVRAEATARALELLASMSARLQQAARLETTTFESLAQAVQREAAQFKSSAQAHGRWEKLCDFLCSTAVELFVDLSKREASSAQAERHALETKVVASEHSVRNVESEMARLKESSTERARAAQAEIDQLKLKAADLGRVQVQLQKVQQAAGNAETQTHSLRSELASAERREAEAKDKGKELQRALEGKNAQLAAAEEKLSAFQMKHAAADRSAQSDIGTLQEQLVNFSFFFCTCFFLLL